MAHYCKLITIFATICALFCAWLVTDLSQAATAQTTARPTLKKQSASKKTSTKSQVPKSLTARKARADKVVAREEKSEPHEIVKDLDALGYITWWSHDSNGYRPAILVKIQNTSNEDLTGELIRFQARFLDLRYGSVTVGRTEVHQDFGKGKVLYVLLKGRDATELSGDANEWPVLECKIMCRVGEVEDEGTQTLLITKVDAITMTDDDAFYKINRMNDTRRTINK
jgi:hypothetical protein